MKQEHHHHRQQHSKVSHAPPVESSDNKRHGRHVLLERKNAESQLILSVDKNAYNQKHHQRRRNDLNSNDDKMQEEVTVDPRPPEQPSSSCPNNDALSASARCIALEQAYVHDVYSKIARESRSSSPIPSHIKEFLFEEFENGSILLDVGCSDGKYLRIHPGLFILGLERCQEWFNLFDTDDIKSCQERKSNWKSRVRSISSPLFADFLLGDVLHIPMRQESLDGVLCCGVLHHVSTTDRRIRALRELSRLLKKEGKVLITVWAFEGRQLSSQDVLIRWNSHSSYSSVQSKERRGNHRSFFQSSSCQGITTSSSWESDDDDDSSNSSSRPSLADKTSTYVNCRTAYESCNSPTTEFGTCYSFVRRALLKFNLSPSTLYYATSATAKSNFVRNQSQTRRKWTTSSSSRRQHLSSSSSSTFHDDIPIELPNIQHPTKILNPHDLNAHNNKSMKKTNMNGSILKEKPFSSTQTPSPSSRSNSLKGSFVSLFREHILSKAYPGGRRNSSDINGKNGKDPPQDKSSPSSLHPDTSSTSSPSIVMKHRLSLPNVVNSRQERHFPEMHEGGFKEEPEENTCPDDKMCSHSSKSPTFRPRPTRYPKIDEVDSRQESLDVKESSEIDDEVTTLMTKRNSSSTMTSAQHINRKKTFGRTLQKSLSSDSIDSKPSRQQSINTESNATTYSVSGSGTSTSSHLVAYYSMPELRALERSSSEDMPNPPILRGRKSRPKITDLHPITFLEEVDEVPLPFLPIRREVKRESSQDTEAAIDEMEMMFQSIEQVPSGKSIPSRPHHHPNPLLIHPPLVQQGDSFNDKTSSRHKDKFQLNLKNSPRYLQPILSERENHEEYDCDDEDESIEEGKEKTQRSSSVEYKAKISPSYRQTLRRFSASPSTKPLVTFSPEESQHEPHPSIDSEESFVTIIPANRSCRGSLDVPFDDNESQGSFLDDVILDVESLNGIGTTNTSSRVSAEPPGDERTSRMDFTHFSFDFMIPRNPPNSRLEGAGEVDDNQEASNEEMTSSKSRGSSVTPTGTSATSTPSPPGELHRYFHLFRCGELEDLITNNVQDLHVIRSYYSEQTTSWCVVCEKI